jgi:hypothetical protein
LTYAVVGDGQVTQSEIENVVALTIQPAFDRLTQQGGRQFAALPPVPISGGTLSRSPCGVVPVGPEGCWFDRDEARECLREKFKQIGGEPVVKIVVERLDRAQGCFDGEFVFVNRVPGMRRIVLHELGHQEGGLCDETPSMHGVGADCPNCTQGAPPRGCGGSQELDRELDTCVMGASEAIALLFCQPCRLEIARRAARALLAVDGPSLLLSGDLSQPESLTLAPSRLGPQVAEVSPSRYATIVTDSTERVVAFSTSANAPFRVRSYQDGGLHRSTALDRRAFVQVRIPESARPPFSVSLVRLVGALPERVTTETIGTLAANFEVSPTPVAPAAQR